MFDGHRVVVTCNAAAASMLRFDDRFVFIYIFFLFLFLFLFLFFFFFFFHF